MRANLDRQAVLHLSGLAVVALLVALGTAWAFQRGANDFSVFYEAWRLVLSGRADEIYRVSPDRYLYAPGFAWLLAPLGLLPRSISLGVWCLMKAAALGWMVRILASRLTPTRPVLSWACASTAVVMVARPLLIDFQYGQVNIFLLFFAIWALTTGFDPRGERLQAYFAWFGIAIFSVAKLITLPLLALPWIAYLRTREKRWLALGAASLAGLVLILAAPMMTLGISGTLTLYPGWQQALIDRGLPMESHNQSFAAFLHHYLSGNPTHVVAQHRSQTYFLPGTPVLSASAIRSLSIGWTLTTLAALLFWIFRRPGIDGVRWIAVSCGLLILPSHLVWKPYFVFSLPIAAVAIRDFFSRSGKVSAADFAVLVVLFAFINLSGFDFVGRELGGWFEAASLLLFSHLALLALVWRGKS